jgi:hypothetical protein
MMNSQTYVSDPRIWEAFYKNMAEKKFNPYRYKPKQIGRGMRSYKSYVIPLRPHSQLESVQQTSTQMTPVATVEERAKVEHAKDVKEGVPFVKVQGSIKRPRSQSSTIPSKKSKRTTPPNPRKRKKSSKPAKQRKRSGKTKQKSVKKQQGAPGKKTQSRTKKEFKIDSYKSIFKQ